MKNVTFLSNFENKAKLGYGLDIAQLFSLLLSEQRFQQNGHIFLTDIDESEDSVNTLMTRVKINFTYTNNKGDVINNFQFINYRAKNYSCQSIEIKQTEKIYNTEFFSQRPDSNHINRIESILSDMGFESYFKYEFSSMDNQIETYTNTKEGSEFSGEVVEVEYNYDNGSIVMLKAYSQFINVNVIKFKL